ncbi:MAG TPA: LacI family DNA-binding transcriptional regulator [Vicinamibacterales bacterium]|nr:LacI family DNA-binding transcriptional regulator [Vicinamibacterales bacterium]
MANIYDVARTAEVSVATVSAVVNGTAYVSPHLKARVESAIKALGYQPNHLARGLATQQSRTLGMIVPDIANPFFPEVVRGAEDTAYAAGYTLLIASSDNDTRKEELYLRLFLSKRVDGVILTKAPGRLSSDLQRAFVAASVPIVLLARTVPGLPADVVEMDDKGAALEGVMHLHRLGYRRIAFIGGLPGASTSRRRLDGYRAALRAAKRRFEPALVVDGDFRVESGYRAGLELLKRRPDAVFIANYLMTVGFMEALRQYRMRCPDDVAVVTCDDHPWLDAFSPRLTTIDLPKRELGAAAAQLVVERIAHPRARLRRVTLKNALRVRESCGCAARETTVVAR